MKTILELNCDNELKKDALMRMLTADDAYLLLWKIKNTIKEFYSSFDESDYKDLDSIGVLDEIVDKIHKEYDRSGIDLDLLP